MAGITLSQAEAALALWLAADQAVATGQSYSIGTGSTQRTLTRANAAEIRNNIDYWNNWVIRLSRANGGGIRARGATPS